MSYARGDIVIVEFPFNDLSSTKIRPAIVISNDRVNIRNTEVILAQITSQRRNDAYSFELKDAYLTTSLGKDSEVRCHKIFTASTTIIRKRISSLEDKQCEQLFDKIAGFLD